MREREIRDRLFIMTEAQILSHFGDSLFDGRNHLLMDAILLVRCMQEQEKAAKPEENKY